MRADRVLLGTGLLTLLSSLLAAGGCTIWFLANQDPEGLACDPDGKCLEGYTCIDNVCLLASAVELGQPCQGDSECVENAVCTNVYDEASCGGYISCDIGRQVLADADQLRCRKSCNPNDEPTDNGCSVGELCHPDAVATNQGWCQSGVCSTPSDCGTNPISNQPNVCEGGDVNPGGTPGSGLCIESCRPLQCNEQTGCSDCSLRDRNQDGVTDVMTCIPIDIMNQTGCALAGIQEADAQCDGRTSLCVPGSFCSTLLTGEALGFCTKWCDPGGGNPACNAAHPTCNPVGGTNFGFCS
jgi:hypothetical protein